MCQMISLKSEPQPTTNDLPGTHQKSRIYRAEECNAMKLQLLALFMPLVFLIGCATAPESKVSVDLLDFLVDGQTSRTEVLLKLGQPSAKFETEKILTYQLGVTAKTGAYYVVERRTESSSWPNWTRAKYSLVLVFDENGVLRKHSKVQVN